MTPQTDPYRTLGLAPGASLNEIRSAYRRLAKLYHPDAAGERALPRFLAIQAAYERLVDGEGRLRTAGRGGAPGARGGAATGGEPWRADPARARASRDAWRARRAAADGGSGLRRRRRGGRAVAAAGRPRRAVAGQRRARPRRAPIAARRAGHEATSRPAARRRPTRKARPGSTTYDEAAGHAARPLVGGRRLVRAVVGDVLDAQPARVRGPAQARPRVPGASAAREGRARDAGPGPGPVEPAATATEPRDPGSTDAEPAATTGAPAAASTIPRRRSSTHQIARRRAGCARSPAGSPGPREPDPATPTGARPRRPRPYTPPLQRRTRPRRHLRRRPGVPARAARDGLGRARRDERAARPPRRACPRRRRARCAGASPPTGSSSRPPAAASCSRPPGGRPPTAIFRRHALLEWLLTSVVGLSWAESDVEAARLQGALSPRVEARLDDLLGHPETCPHGNPIDLETARRRPAGTPLSELESGSRATVLRITEEAEEDAGLLSYLEARALTPGAHVTVLARSESLDSLTLDGPRGRATLGLRPAALIRVIPGEADPALFHRVPPRD